MKIPLPLTLFAFAAVFLAGCGREAGSHDDHAGHDHGPVNLDIAATTTAHAHESTDETCFICDASKRDQGRLWCREHGRYEDRCWLCHPELEAPDRLWCREHALYEDECFLCHPELKEGSSAAAPRPPARSTSSAELFCHEHQVAEIECGICQPGLAASLTPGQNLKIRFPSPQSADRAGVRTASPRFEQGAPKIRALCEARYNLNALARVTPLAAGVIRRVHHDLGDTVEADAVLVELHSADVATAKSEYLAARVQSDIARQAFEREKRLRAQNIAAEKDLLEAEAAHRTATLAVARHRQHLLNFGLTAAEISAIEETQDTSALLRVRAPFTGTLVERSAVVGEAVAVGDALFTLADLSTRWLTLSIPADALQRIEIGQGIEATFPDLPGEVFEARISWVDTSIDSRSRLVHARAIVPRASPALKNGLYGEARILLAAPRTAALLPRDAVQRHEGSDFVFVREEPDLFALRRVELGGTLGDRVEIVAGLRDQDAVVMDGSFVVMSEFLKSRLGAGCADH